MQHLTVNILNSSLLKANNKRGFIFLLCSFYINFLAAQSLVLSFEKEVPIEEVAAVSMDRNGYFYLADFNGNVRKLNAEGVEIYKFSPDKPGIATNLESWQTLRTLVFYADFQEYVFLDRFLNSSPLYNIEQAGFGFVSLLTLSEDNQLWLFDNENISLTKYDYNTNQITLRAPINNYVISENNNLNFLKTYQQQLFLNDKLTGILVFDIFGNYIKTLPYPGLDYFNFYKNSIYFIKENNIVLIDLYSLSQREITLPDEKPYAFAFVQDDHVVLIDKKAMSFYKIKKKP